MQHSVTWSSLLDISVSRPCFTMVDYGRFTFASLSRSRIHRWHIGLLPSVRVQTSFKGASLLPKRRWFKTAPNLPEYNIWICRRIDRTNEIKHHIKPLSVFSRTTRPTHFAWVEGIRYSFFWGSFWPYKSLWIYPWANKRNRERESCYFELLF